MLLAALLALSLAEPGVAAPRVPEGPQPLRLRGATHDARWLSLLVTEPTLRAPQGMWQPILSVGTTRGVFAIGGAGMPASLGCSGDTVAKCPAGATAALGPSWTFRRWPVTLFAGLLAGTSGGPATGGIAGIRIGLPSLVTVLKWIRRGRSRGWARANARSRAR